MKTVQTAMLIGAETRLCAPDPATLSQAAEILRNGGLVAFPTETVYGLGADATHGAAVAGIYAAKARPSFNPLISHVADFEAAQQHGVFNDDARKLARRFWPGPLTLVVPATQNCRICELARAGLNSVALRVPDHPVARALLAVLERPVAAPSANRSGHVSPTSAAHVMQDLAGRIDMVIDGGDTSIGVESTIVACLEGTPVLLRPGGVPREALVAVLGGRLRDPPDQASTQAPVSPGLLASHYAPRAVVRLNAQYPDNAEAALDFGHQFYRVTGVLRLDLSPSGDLREAAANLFGHLRKLDASGAASIAAAPIPHTGLGEAINDRLMRAAAPRQQSAALSDPRQ